jgi:hypothetical protein
MEDTITSQCRKGQFTNNIYCSTSCPVSLLCLLMNPYVLKLQNLVDNVCLYHNWLLKVFELYRLCSVKWKNDDQGIYMNMTLSNM